MAKDYLTKFILKSLLISREIAFDSLNMKAIVIPFTDDFSNNIELGEVSLKKFQFPTSTNIFQSLD